MVHETHDWISAVLRQTCEFEVEVSARSCWHHLLLCAAHLRPYDEKFNFYADLGKLWERTSTNAEQFLFGDFNARIAKAKPGEEDVFGPYGHGVEAAHRVEVPNRDFFFGFWHTTTLSQTCFNGRQQVKKKRLWALWRLARGIALQCWTSS